jgi:hypothetical protein
MSSDDTMPDSVNESESAAHLSEEELHQLALAAEQEMLRFQADRRRLWSARTRRPSR